MKPLYANNTRLSRCPCCVSKKSKGVTRTRKYGNAVGRQQAEKLLRKELNRGSD